MSKPTRSDLGRKAQNLPELRFETQQLTSFSGLVVIQALFDRLNVAGRLRRAFPLQSGQCYGLFKLFTLLVVHLLLGFRRLRDAVSYRGDPLVKRLVGLTQLPDVSTMSRRMAQADSAMLRRAHAENRRLVLEGLRTHGLRRYTLDFDGSVLSTRRHAEGTAVGFNPKRKGERSYYPLLCTVAQSAQAFDFLHRPGNVHDSQGAGAFMEQCIGHFRSSFEPAALEVRADSAFFNEQLVSLQTRLGTEFSMSVPFERFPELKRQIEQRRRWKRADRRTEFFELRWRPACWQHAKVRLLAVRQAQPRQRKAPLQLDLFEPVDFEYQYSVIATNKTGAAAPVIGFHHGRGSQENIIGELKSTMQMDYIPCRSRRANELYMLAAVFAHNLTHAMQMQGTKPHRKRHWTRPACWVFEAAHSLRMTVLHRAGRLSNPANRPTLTISGDHRVARKFERLLDQLRPAA
jgi:hypothetical protein